VVRYALPEISPLFKVAYFGKNFRGEIDIDWTLPCKDDAAKMRTSMVLRAMGNNLYYAPNTSVCNALRIPRSVMQNRLELEPGVRVFGNKYEPGDTITLSSGEGVVSNPAGCGVACAKLGNIYNVSHLSRRSLVCSNRVLNSVEAWRRCESVTETLVRGLGPLAVIREVQVWLRCFIPTRAIPYSLTLEPWANFNRLMREYVSKRWGSGCVTVEDDVFYVDLSLLARVQLEKLGVLSENIDTTEPYISGDVWLDGRVDAPRNLQVVVKT
jgi:hypothetical protein